MWVSPFRYPRLSGYLLLPAAFRSLSRLSSALSAKASSLRPFLLDLFVLYSVIRLVSLGFGSFYCLFSSFRHLLMTASDVSLSMIESPHWSFLPPDSLSFSDIF